MTVSVVQLLGDQLDDLTVNATTGMHSITFPYVPYGRHFDDANWTISGNRQPGVLTCRKLATPTTPSDIGGGAEQVEENIETIVMWEDDADLTKPEEFKDDVVRAVEDVIQSNETGLLDQTSGGVQETNFFLSIRNVNDAAALIRNSQGRAPVLKNQVNITIRAKGVKTGWR